MAETMGKVLTYSNNDRTCYCSIKLSSGERILISIANTPRIEVRIYKMNFWGLIPGEVVWEWQASGPGNYADPPNLNDISHDLDTLIELFANPSNPEKHLLDGIKDKLIQCKSIAEVLKVLSG